MTRKPMSDYDRFLQTLSPTTRKQLQPTKRVDVTGVDELSTRPKWWLIVVPDGGPAELSSYCDEAEFLAAVRKAYRLELGQVFMFFGTRALIADQMHGASAVPYVIIPGGRMMPLFERSPKLSLRKDGFVGDPLIDAFLHCEPAENNEGSDSPDADNGTIPEDPVGDA